MSDFGHRWTSAPISGGIGRPTAKQTALERVRFLRESADKLERLVGQIGELDPIADDALYDLIVSSHWKR